MGMIRMNKKSVYNIVSDAFRELERLKPTVQEIQEYADMKESKGESCGVVTYLKSKSGDVNFLKFHDTWKHKRGGRIHIDIGFIDEELREKNFSDTIHLMLDKDDSPEFINFVKKKRGK